MVREAHHHVLTATETKQEVAKAGKAKREELSDYLVTTDGHTLVARVAKLLTYARHQEVRPVAAMEERFMKHWPTRWTVL